MDAEERARREAVRRALAGELAKVIAAALGRSERWVFKWLGRYDPKDEGWARSRSRAPRQVANRSDPALEALVVQVRAELQANPWAQVGSAAVAWELHKLGVRRLPQLRTIERILARAGVPRRERAARYAAKGTPYPAPRAIGANALQELDIIGPRYLAGGVLLFVLAVVDLGRHAAAWELLPSKSDGATAQALLRIWRRLGIPRRLQLDNWLIPNMAPSAGWLPKLVRLCLANDVTPVFIPFSEPWRNGTVEHLNDTFDKRFFRAERFRDVRHLERRMQRFERFHDTHHRYAALRGRTPSEASAAMHFQPRFPDAEATVPDVLPRRGQVEFIRLIRSDRQLRLLGRSIEVPEKLVHEYVTATVHVRSQTLTLRHLDHLVWVRRFPVR